MKHREPVPELESEEDPALEDRAQLSFTLGPRRSDGDHADTGRDLTGDAPVRQLLVQGFAHRGVEIAAEHPLATLILDRGLC